MSKVRCRRCGGTNVQALRWFDPNTGEAHDYPDMDGWCSDCERDDVRLSWDESEEIDVCR